MVAISSVRDQGISGSPHMASEILTISSRSTRFGGCHSFGRNDVAVVMVCPPVPLGCPRLSRFSRVAMTGRSPARPFGERARPERHGTPRRALLRPRAGARSRCRSFLANRQRGWKLQPVGGLIGLGTSPCSTMRSALAVGLNDGAADKQRARVGMLRVRINLLGWRDLDDLAEIHHGDRCR